jgi:hypothetical protein
LKFEKVIEDAAAGLRELENLARVDVSGILAADRNL